MAWPQAQDYNEAIQSPSICFYDLELKQGKVRPDKHGLPKAIAGGFANVYELTTPSGRWAVRCFVREIPDSQSRYSEISKTLSTLNLPYTTPFVYQQKGILVGGRPYPIVKMQWMSGDLLGEYIDKNVHNPAVITQLSEKWAAMIADLRARGIAHGDLQHDNVLLVNNDLRLIDYDGMFVPAFRGMKANEIGHPNYQHPRRQPSDFGPHIDNFSAWLIYASLKILAAYPHLHSYARSLGREQCILLNRDDLSDPTASPIFGELRSQPDDVVRKLTEEIAKYVALAPHAVPPLDVTGFGSPGVIVIPVTAPSEWWKDHAPAPAGPKPNTPPPSPAPTLPSYELGPQPAAQREMIGFLALSIVAFIGERLTGAIGTFGYLIVQVAILLAGKYRFEERFKSCPEGSARERHLQDVALKDEERTEKVERLEQNRKKLQDIMARQAAAAAELQRALSDLAKEQGEQVRTAFTQQAVARAGIDRHKRAIAEEEARALQNAVGQLEQESRELQSAIKAFASKRDGMLRNALEHSRNTSLNHLLGTHPVNGADLTGIGGRLKLNLVYAGIRTAADVTFGKVRVVDDFGQVRTSKVVAWRDGLAARYESRLPTRLQNSEIKPIDDYIRSKTDDLENQNRVIQQKIIAAKTNNARHYDARRAQLVAEEAKIQNDHKNVVAGINAQHASNVSAKQTSFNQLRQNLEREATSVRIAISNLESENQRLQAWLRDIGAPRTKAYEAVNLANFARKVFLEKFTS